MTAPLPYGIRVTTLCSPVAFSDLIEGTRRRLTAEGHLPHELPLSGLHILWTLSEIQTGHFLATLGFDSAGHLVTTNTARLYPLTEDAPTIRRLFETCRLWLDDPDHYAPGMTCVLTSDDPRFDERTEAAIHLGTAWVRRDLRGAGLGKQVLQLHRLNALEHLGAHRMFGTTGSAKSGSWTGGEAAGSAVVSMTTEGPVEHQVVRLYEPEQIAGKA